MTETITEILNDVGFEHWDEVDQAKMAALVKNVASCEDITPHIVEASILVRRTFLRCCNMWLDMGD